MVVSIKSFNHLVITYEQSIQNTKSTVNGFGIKFEISVSNKNRLYFFGNTDGSYVFCFVLKLLELLASSLGNNFAHVPKLRSTLDCVKLVVVAVVLNERSSRAAVAANCVNAPAALVLDVAAVLKANSAR